MSLLRRVEAWLFDSVGNGITSTNNALDVNIKDSSIDMEAKDFLFKVNAGFLEGYKQIRKYGANLQVSLVGTEYVWDGGVEYNYPIANETISVMSSDGADTTVELTVEGLVENGGDWEEQVITVTLNGTTPVTVGSFIRVYRMRASNGVSPVGAVYASSNTANPPSDTDLRAQISLNNGVSRNSTLMAMYTVPSNKTVFMYRGYTATRKNEDAEFDFQIRPFNSNFFTAEIIPIYQSSNQFELGYERVEEKSDIRVAVTSETNNAKAYASFHMVIVDNDKL